ncbi:MAG: hypothetical protein ABFE01_21640 [Phycisphaerales bacterium]
MVERVMRSVVLTVLTGLILTGCGRQGVRNPSRGSGLPATGPVSASTPRSFILPSIEAVGGLPAWRQTTKLDLDGIVAAYNSDGGVYLTEHQFSVYPWSDSIQVTASEPRVRMSWQVSYGRCTIKGDTSLDASPLNGSYHEYADAVLEIVTAPARLMDDNVSLTRKPIPIQIAGQWYQPIEARFQPRETVSDQKGGKRVTVHEPYWTQGIYFQDQGSSVVNMIWLANPGEQRYLLVRGYDYARAAGTGVLLPAKIEIFRSDRTAQFGPRLALIDFRR